MSLKRMWINQPSTLQQFHHLHATNVLVDWPDQFTQTARIYFLDGAVHSQEIPKHVLSSGWQGTHDKTFKVDWKFYANLEQLQAQFDLDSPSEVLKKAIALLKVVELLRDEENAVLIINKHNQPTKVLL